MADISGLIVTVLGLSFELTSTLYSYSRDVKGATKDIQQLSNELFALIGVLEHIKRQQEHESSGPQDRRKVISETGNLTRVLNETIEFLHGLQDSLTPPKGRFHAAAQRLKWPLKEKDTQAHLTRLERAKSYFILSQVTEDIDLSHEIASQITDLCSLIRQTSFDDKVEKRQRVVDQVINSLSPVNQKETFDTVAKSRVATSGVWITRTGQIQRWTESPTSTTFWLNGITGAGKTTLMTTIVDSLNAKGTNGAVIYYYCSFAVAESLMAKNIFGSILAQICNSDEITLNELISSYKHKGENGNGSLGSRTITEDRVLELIISSLRRRESLYILIDGVNECNDPQYIIECLSKIIAACPTCSTHLFISSINEKDIDNAIEALPDVTTENLRPIDVQNDIRSLVLASLETDPRLRRHNAKIKQEIEWALTRGANGMFRWVQCQLDILSRLRTPGAVKNALENLPPTLDKTYEGLLERIDSEEDRKLTRDILELVCFSFRPFTLTEIHELLQITPGLRKLDESKCLSDPKDILSICGSLLNYQHYTGHVTLAHHSVQTYLTSALQGDVSYFRLTEEDAHRSLATKCLTYLSFDAFSGGPQDKFSPTRQYKQFPLLLYAAQRWALHAGHVKELGDPLWVTTKEFLFSQDHGRGNFLFWVQLLIPSASIKSITQTPPLYYAASYGLTTVVRYLIEAGADIEVHAGRCGATPLNIACFRGHYDVAKLLLEHGADPHALDKSPGWNAFQWAKYNRHVKVYELLTKADLVAKEPVASLSAYADHSASHFPPEQESFGRLVVTKAERDPRWPCRLWWVLVGLAEYESRHPIGEAIKEAAKRRLAIQGDHIPGGIILSFENISGMGVQAFVEVCIPALKSRYTVIIGQLPLLRAHGCSSPEDLEVDWTYDLDEDSESTSGHHYGRTWVAIDGCITGAISLSLYT